MWWGKTLWLFNKKCTNSIKYYVWAWLYCNRLVNTDLCVFSSACRQIWGQLRMTFCLQVTLWLRSRAPVHLAGRSVHKLSSLRNATSLPPKKMQSLLYPFSGLEAHLDRCSDEILWYIQPKLCWVMFVNQLESFLRSVDRMQFQLFHPSVEDMMEAEKLFCSSPSHRIDYYVSAERMDHAPTLKQPEVGTPPQRF